MSRCRVWPVVLTLVLGLWLVFAGCGKAKPKPDPNYRDPAADPTALPATPADLDRPGR